MNILVRKIDLRAFTLLELLVVISIIGILAALLAPVLSAAKKRAAQAACINNLKQLGLGMQIYVQDNGDTFPGIASRHSGYHPEDWIYWRTNTALYPSFESSPILTSVPGMQKPSLRCPLDNDDHDRLTYNYGDSIGPYLFSYSLNGYGLDANGNNLGMSTLIKIQGGVTNKCPFKEGAVRDPGDKIMLAEEPGTLAGWDNPDSGSSGVAPICDGRWVPSDYANNITDPLTIRHGGKADVTFADFHVEPVTPDFGAELGHNLAGQ